MYSVKRFLPLLLIGCLSLLSFTNNEPDPIRWNFSAKLIKANEFMLIFEAKMNTNWYIYAQDLLGEAQPTTFYFLPNNQIEFTAPTIEEKGNAIEANSLKIYKNRVVFTTNVRLKEPKTQLLGYVNYVTCDGTRCLSPKDIPFEFVFGK